MEDKFIKEYESYIIGHMMGFARWLNNNSVDIEYFSDTELESLTKKYFKTISE